jgi:hypothetical protein
LSYDELPQMRQPLKDHNRFKERHCAQPLDQRLGRALFIARRVERADDGCESADGRIAV